MIGVRLDGSPAPMWARSCTTTATNITTPQTDTPLARQGEQVAPAERHGVNLAILPVRTNAKHETLPLAKQFHMKIGSYYHFFISMGAR